MTGLYPHQHKVTGNDPTFSFDGKRYGPEWLQARKPHFSKIEAQYYQNTQLTQFLQQKDYLSLQTGKWWMGSWEDAYFTHGMTHGDPARKGRHGDEGLKIGREGLQPIYDVIEEADSLNKPFFVWYAPFLPHAPHTPPQALEEKYLATAPTPAIARYWAMCEWFDQTCGDLLDHLDEKGIADNTLVIYVCDNGWIQEPDKPNRYAARSKRSPYDGGIRTPIMYRWPGKISPVLDTLTLASSIDIVPTILGACGIESDTDLPGLNVMNSDAMQARKTIFAEAFEHDIADVEEPTRSLQYRIGVQYPWKLILPDTGNVEGGVVELFNLAEDPWERSNLAKDFPEKVDDLEKAIDAWWVPRHHLTE